MKKFLKFFMIMCALLLISTGIYATTAVDSTTVATATTYSLSFLFTTFGHFISAHIWTVVFFIAFLLSEILAAVKYVPKNSICQILWYALRATVDFFANKKTSGDTTEKATTETDKK